MNIKFTEEGIPKEIYSLILNPIINQEFGNNSEFAKNIENDFFTDSMGNTNFDYKNKYFKLLNNNLKWLLKIESKKYIKKFIKVKYLDVESNFYNKYKQFIILLCKYALKSKFFRENLEDINDIIIEHKEDEFNNYNVKMAFLNTSSDIVNSEIFQSWFKYISKLEEKGSHSYQSLAFPHRKELNYPYLDQKSKVGINDNKIFLTSYLAISDPTLVKFQKIYLVFSPDKKSRKLWDDISKETIEKIIEIIEGFPYISLITFKNFHNLHPLILNSIKNLKQKESPLISSFYQSKVTKLITATQYKMNGFDLELKRFNIFIGKNNSGKTYALKELYENCNTLLFNEEVKSLDTGSPNRPKKEFYFIPKNRILENSRGTYENIHPRLHKFYKILSDLKNFNVRKENQTWIIPNFADIIELFTTEYSENLEELDKIILKKVWPIFIKFKEVFENWRSRIYEFFKIRIKKPERIGKGANFIIKSDDQLIHETIVDWISFGSGTQEFFNMIFFIEYLKYGPIVNLKKFPSNISKSTEFDECTFLMENYRALFIDEPELSLHPSLLRNFYKYLLNASKKIQIFIGTHSTQFLEVLDFFTHLNKNLSLILCLKGDFEDNNFKKLHITKNNIMCIIDEMFNFDVFETAVYLSKSNYNYFSLIDYYAEDFNIGKFIKIRYSQDPDFKELLKLGTVYEDPKNRIIQNAYFLSFPYNDVRLQSDFNDINQLKKVFLCQLNKYPNEKSRIENNEFNELINFCCYCWDKQRCEEHIVLSYNEEKSKKVCERIKELLGEMKSEGIPEKKSLLVFPENTVPYDALKLLIEFAAKNKIVIVGGMEHRTISEIYEKLDKLGDLSKNYIHIYQYYILKGNKEIKKDTFLNQAVIINANGLFTFQIKHVPVYFKKKDTTEGIPILLEHQFKKILTVIGDIAVFICKDFLVNYELIDKWMKIHDVKIMVVPSFTELFYPFKNKFGELISLKENEDKTFIFANVAKYGGSGIYKYSLRRKYEYGKINLLGPYEESWKSWVFD